MALTFSLLLSHSKNRFALSLLLLLPLLLAALFVAKQSVPVFSLSLSTSSELTLFRTPPLNHSHSQHLLTLPPSPLLPPPQEEEPSISPSFPPLPLGEDTAADDEDDRGKDEDSTSLPSPPPLKDEQISKPEPAGLSTLERGFALAADRKDEAVKSRGAKKCNLYKGTWVRDDEGRYPLYAPGSCPYVDEAFSCQENGRQDDDYLKWKWKPDDCELPW